MQEILIIGAFDRYNYGDLLFPLVIEKQLLELHKDLVFKYYGLVRSDLSSVGGKLTGNLQDFYHDVNKSSVHVIIAGGEAIDATWSSLYASLNPNFSFVEKIIRKSRLPFNVNKVAKLFLGGRTDFPLSVSKVDFKNAQSVIYNSLGGSNIPRLSKHFTQKLVTTIKNVDYVSVRDRTTQNNILNLGVSSYLYPDSAILMSKFFPISYLEKLVSKEVLDFVNSSSIGYLFFQANKNFCRKYSESIVQQLQKINKDTGVKVCLCPIGLALNHEDHIGLEIVKNKLSSDTAFFQDVTIWDIMYLIANAKCYIGTSLHGAITAMSFSRPYIGLQIPKLNSYLQSWGVNGINKVFMINEISNAFRVAIDIDQDILKSSSEEQIELIEASFDKMSSIIFKNTNHGGNYCI